MSEPGYRGNWKMGNNCYTWKPQQKATGLKTEQHSEGADREGGTCFINRTERLRNDLPLVLQSKQLKNRRQNLKVRDSSENTMFLPQTLRFTVGVNKN